MIHAFPDLVQPKVQREVIAHSILAALGAPDAPLFYRLVAIKISERVIRSALA